MNKETTGTHAFPGMRPRGRRWDHLELLERIDTSGSISSAASDMGMSYKAAWQAVEGMNNLSEQPVVERQTGGRNGVHEDDVVTFVDRVLELLGFRRRVPVGDEGRIADVIAGIFRGGGSFLNVQLIADTVGVAFDNSIVGRQLQSRRGGFCSGSLGRLRGCGGFGCFFYCGFFRGGCRGLGASGQSEHHAENEKNSH